jgi:hypothetical protein
VQHLQESPEIQCLLEDIEYLWPWLLAPLKPGSPEHRKADKMSQAKQNISKVMKLPTFMEVVRADPKMKPKADAVGHDLGHKCQCLPQNL